ncbi:maleylacetoacetate isomerase [Thalassotalea marina]|uniref:Maleylacetoacetate isomerase n=1 Tax=Thalassotalea marina TaxID=1673741 RepID=A0A919BLJ4_9GAMM|nr:maleylacetoacetate isomerase [Thalassotalea marina]GHF98312.1 maleylacetoacetate isomerase [Thalassotalea marina]
MKLYGYWRSSAAYRVRIALNLKGINYQSIPVHLVKDGGEQHKVEYAKLNPTELVPTLIDGEVTLNQSLAIIDYLEAKFPETPLYPSELAQKAQVQAAVLDIACEIHPINNLRVQQYLVKELNVSEEQKLAWSHHWMTLGFHALEKKLAATAGKYCFGDQVTAADITLVPQIYNARRFNVDLSEFPTICRIVDNCNLLPAFISALPENQDDAS